MKKDEKEAIEAEEIRNELRREIIIAQIKITFLALALKEKLEKEKEKINKEV